MATSSIFTNVVIRDPKAAEIFINALETSTTQPGWEPTTSAEPPLTDLNAIRELFARRESN